MGRILGSHGATRIDIFEARRKSGAIHALPNSGRAAGFSIAYRSEKRGQSTLITAILRAKHSPPRPRPHPSDSTNGASMVTARVRDRRVRLPPTKFEKSDSAPRDPSKSRRRPAARRHAVNSLSEEQLTLLYNAPDAVAGALGAEAAALGEFAGKASEAFATKVVPALKEGGDALKPAVEQALTTGASSASGAFAAVVDAGHAAGWTDTELAGATTIALFLTVATIKKQATPPPPPPPTPAEKAAVGAKKALSGRFGSLRGRRGGPTRPSSPRPSRTP